MGKRKQQVRKQVRQEQRREKRLAQEAKDIQISTISKIWKIVFSVVSGLGLSLGIAVGVLSLLPRISVSQSTPLNPDNPFSTPFTLSNDGYLSVLDVKFRCELRNVATNKFIVIKGLDTIAADVGIKQIAPGGKWDIPCAFVRNAGEISKAEISVVAEFRPAFVPWYKERKDKFHATRDSNGHWRWLHGEQLSN